MSQTVSRIRTGASDIIRQHLLTHEGPVLLAIGVLLSAWFMLAAY